MSKFSELAGLPTTTHESGVTAPPVEPEIPTNLKWLSKIKLEEIGRTLGIELDRRLSQPKLVEQLESHIASLDG